ncbi:TonB-dependent receptor plug domain-containing protein [Pedobacter nutrimenti]|uniref:Outer membrane cobalamin receptor n=1 Tax=Pedobacter nutrimenti TaxID=1241337 RepID=A0A318UFR3_9SPHI|nr:TonB-dependent receptor [Pedobacter nutrimenti]PYF74330.1 outer membrane cobalamin receptor [Pedobacter nutrimenti]
MGKIPYQKVLVLLYLLLPITLWGQNTEDKGKALKNVTVKGKKMAVKSKEQPQNLSVIDASKYYNRPEGAIALINQSAGIKVRQSGGLGSFADVYINGMSGKQVKFFIDGIPLDYLGAGLGLNILPINSIDRIEIYKGVVPVKLGADALGGAIDVITRKSLKDYIDASYEISSFNTHRASLNLKKSISPLFYTDLSAFYNHSDNNYKIDAEIPVNGTLVPIQVKRFHDRFSSYYANATIGITPQKWADELSFFTALSSLDQQLQNNRMMTQPYGEVNYDEQAWNNGLKYSKAKIGGHLSINAYVGINAMRNHYVDTSLNTYLWDGSAPPAFRRSSGGESGPRQQPKTKISNRIARINALEEFNDQTRLTANIIASSYSQSDDNPATANYPVKLQKLVAGLAFEKDLLDGRLTSITSLKYFNYSARGYSISTQDSRSLSDARSQQSRFGWSQALRYRISEVLLLKASYEYATRLPDEQELFGTYFNRVYPNPSLRAEVSHNLNAGLQFNGEKSGFEVNAFYRRADNLIFSPPSSSALFSIYQNLLKGQITGLDAEYSYKITDALRLRLNATWQNYISKTDAENTGTGNSRGYYNQRLPNIPFLFSNGELLYVKPGVFKKDDSFSAWYNGSYVHWFYLYWAKDGDPDQKLRIPTQYVQSSGISYAIKNNKYNLSFQVDNLADAKVYDNYGVQRPGRSFHLKFRTFIQ